MFIKKRSVLLVSTALSAAIVSSPISADEAEKALEMHEMTVTADPLGARSPDELLIPVTVLSGDELEKHTSTTIGETLEYLPGVSNSDFGPGVGKPVIRGLQGSRVQVLDDGVKTSDVSSEGGDHAVAISTMNAEQIEVLRGPAALLYGSGAVGGVINVKSPRFDPEFGSSPSLSGHTRYGFNGDEKQGQLNLELPLGEQFVLRADIGHQENDDLDIKGYQQVGQTSGDKDTLQNSETDTTTTAITGLFKGDWGFTALGYSTWESDYGIPGVFLGEGEEELETIEAENDRIDLRGEFYDLIPGINTTRLKISHSDFEQAEIGTVYEDGLVEAQVTETEFDVSESDARIELVHAPFGDWQGVFGFQFNERKFKAEGEGHGAHGHEEDDHDEDEHDEHGSGFYVRDNTMRTTSAFILEEYLTDYGRWEFATRIDHVRANPESLEEDRDIDTDDDTEFSQSAQLADRSFTPISLSAGTIIDVDTTHHVRVSLSRSERAPSAEQLYAFGSHAASGTVEIGDPNLDKETYTNLEIGFDKHTGPVRYRTNLFYNYVDDYIYLQAVDNGTGIAETVDGDTLLLNEQENAKFYGAEISLDWDTMIASLPVTLRFSGDYVRAKLSSGDDLPRISPARLGVGLDTSYGNWDMSVDYRHVFDQNDTAELETETDGYNLVSLHAHYSPQQWQNLELYVQGNNLLNEDGRRHQSFLKDEAPIRGRAIYTGLKFKFN